MTDNKIILIGAGTEATILAQKMIETGNKDVVIVESMDGLAIPAPRTESTFDMKSIPLIPEPIIYSDYKSGRELRRERRKRERKLKK
jgi:hypothetical protein